tara:strand:- start:27761 stop:27994 length:234 start_codon:yes stop_codon:yes gene_type:complete
MADLKKKMDDLEKDRDKSPEAELAYQLARSDWQGAEPNWRKIEQGEEIPKPDPKPRKPKKKPEEEGSSTPPEGGGGA